MTPEDKLLLIDLSARWFYGVIVSVTDGTIKYNAYIESVSYKNIQVSSVNDSNFIAYNFYYKISEIKPYLRPMSSMTEEEKEELKSKCFRTETEEDWEGIRCDSWGIEILNKYDTKRWDNTIYVSSFINMDAIDWLNKNMFDYRELIPKGLANEAPNDMYKI